MGCSGNISYDSAGATVSFVVNPVTHQVTVRDTGGAVIQNARVFAWPSDNTGPFPYQESVTITRSGSTATVTHTSHGLSTNHKVWIRGASQPEYNGVFTVTVTGTNTYTYTVTGTPATPATGTITSSAVILDGATNVSGVISDTRSYASDQPIQGRVRKGSAADSPKYVPATYTGTIDSEAGLSVTVQLIEDE